MNIFNVGFLGSTVVSETIDDTGLKAYLKFNETTGDVINVSQSAVDLGSGADIQITGSSYNQAESPFGYAMLFDGVNDFGVFGTSKSQWNFMHNTTSKFTINFWARMQGFGENYFLSTINTDSYRGVMVRSAVSTQRINAYINSNTSAALILAKNSPNNYLPDTTTWYMYTLTWDISLASNNYSLFRNAANEENANDSGATATDGDNQFVFTIGARASDHIKFLNFYVSELSIWDRVLTDDEITALYNGGSGKEIY